LTNGDELYGEAVGLIEAGDLEKSLQLLDLAIEKSREQPDDPLTHTRALLQRGLVRESLGDNQKALSDYDTVVSFSEAASDTAREIAAWALHRKGLLLQRLGELEDALATFRALEDTFAGDGAIEVKRLVAAALVSAAGAREELGQDNEVVRLAEDLVSRFGSENDSEIRLDIARVLAKQAIALDRMGKLDDALAAYDDLLGHLDARLLDVDSRSHQHLAWGLANKTSSLVTAERFAEVISAAEETRGRFGTCDDPSLRAAVATALINRARSFDALGRKDEELAAYEEVIALYESAREPQLEALVLLARINRAAVLREVGRDEDAVEAYADVVSRYEYGRDASWRDNVARALYFGAEILDELGRRREAIRAYDDLIARFGGPDDNDFIAATVATARERRNSLIAESK
jgi:tetratricopeptide (TPR) repeat protein